MSQHIDPTPKQTSLDALNDRITTLADYYNLANAQAITAGYVEYTNYNNRKFSDYAMLEFTPLVDSWFRNSCVVPSSVLKSMSGVAIYFHEGNNVIEVDVKWKSDTSFEAKYIGTLGKTCYLCCHGWLSRAST